MSSTLVKEQLNQLPVSPGVYLMKDTEGNILYVGKAANLRHRVRSYFGVSQKLSPKLQRLVSRINQLEFFVTASEQEALILEFNLIKQHHPHYNVRLKDDKTYPYLKISLEEAWPRVYLTRRVEEDGGRYFGPFASAKSVRQTLKVLKVIFPFRSCTKPITGTGSRPCLEYHMNLCAGPCIGVVSPQEYAEVIRQVILFLEGRHERIVRELETKMERAAGSLDFEKAALLRDQVQAINEVIQGQKIATTVRGEQDAIAFASDKDQACVQVFFVRGGKLIGRESFTLQGTSAEAPGQIMASFIKQFYGSASHIPPRLLLQHPVADREAILGWLQSKRGAKVYLQVPRRGNQKQLVDIVAENATQGLQQFKLKQQFTATTLTSALTEIERELHLPHLPLRIEGYDISDIQGMAAVGSMIVFDRGKSKPAHYRRFSIKTVPGADDYAMLREVLKRRFKHSNYSNGSTASTWGIMPDLVLVDGGKGQLNAALTAMREADADKVPVASLAKENEEIFIPQQTVPIVLPRTSPGLQLLQRVRDEAHRFALSYHQRVRRQQTFASALDTIPGIGPKRRRALLKRFGSVPAIRAAATEELVATGLSQSLVKKIKEQL
ncbi:excinuclease ABC subunit UvrC [Chloroflexota bacterium]